MALETDVHPGFMTDWQQPTVVALTQAHGLRYALPVRAGFGHLIAALAAEGTSTVYGVNLINRGYEDFEVKLAALGAHAERP